MINGLLIIHKDRGVTSHQVVAQLRRILGQSGIGHTGTLDPEATGVLVVGLGEATRLFQFLEEDSKQYQAQIILGQATDTQDATGQVLKEHPEMWLEPGQIDQAVNQMIGEMDQVPPMYSAVKVQGQKLYDLARRGIEVERKARRITVFDWKVLHGHQHYRFKDDFFNEITCSKGTYIRTLLHDLGMRLGCGAHMGRLVRTRSGVFQLADALTVEAVAQAVQNDTLSEKIIAPAEALGHLPTLEVDAVDRIKVVNGGKLSFGKYELPITLGRFAKVLDETMKLLAVVELKETDLHRYWQPVKVFKEH